VHTIPEREEDGVLGISKPYQGSSRESVTLASLSAARWAYMLGCSETQSILVAWGNEESEHARLGREVSFSARRP